MGGPASMDRFWRLLVLGGIVAAAVWALVVTPGSAAFRSRSTTDLNRNIVIGQLNLWYYGPGPNGGFDAYDGSGRPLVKLTPYFGKYRSSDPRVVRQQIAWAANNGVDAFSIEWITPRGEPGSIEDNLDETFLRAPNLCRIRWLIFDDFILRLDRAGIDFSNGVNFDDPRVRELFIGDLVHFAEKYFPQPQYLRIDGRPVVYIYASWNYQGDVAGAVNEARSRIQKLGYDVYLVGDEVAMDRFEPAHASLWDATTSFSSFLMPGAPPIRTLPGATSFVASAYATWRRKTENLTVVGRMDRVAFQPGFTPQYDDRLFRRNAHFAGPHYIPAKSRAEVERLARASLRQASPIGSDGQRVIWLNTFNNWAETTTVEPTAAKGPRYPAGNYRYDMLHAVRNVFGVGTFGTGASSCSATR